MARRARPAAHSRLAGGRALFAVGTQRVRVRGGAAGARFKCRADRCRLLAGISESVALRRRISAACVAVCGRSKLAGRTSGRCRLYCAQVILCKSSDGQLERVAAVRHRSSPHATDGHSFPSPSPVPSPPSRTPAMAHSAHANMLVAAGTPDDRARIEVLSPATNRAWVSRLSVPDERDGAHTPSTVDAAVIGERAQTSGT
eukprot:IDg19559t1